MVEPGTVVVNGGVVPAFGMQFMLIGQPGTGTYVVVDVAVGVILRTVVMVEPWSKVTDIVFDVLSTTVQELVATEEQPVHEERCEPD